MCVGGGGGGGGEGGGGGNIETKTVSQTFKRGKRQNRNHLHNGKHVVQFFGVCVCVCVGGGDGGIPTKKKSMIGICLFFCAHVLYKISSY